MLYFATNPKSVHVWFVSNHLVQMEILLSLRSAADWFQGTLPLGITKSLDTQISTQNAEIPAYDIYISFLAS